MSLMSYKEFEELRASTYALQRAGAQPKPVVINLVDTLEYVIGLLQKQAEDTAYYNGHKDAQKQSPNYPGKALFYDYYTQRAKEWFEGEGGE
jgi:hypothetical protein